MFSSTNNNPLPQLPSSSFQIPFNDAVGFFPFHTHIDPLLACNYYLAPNYTTNAPLLTSTKLKKGHEDGKKAARKDRHSKISTSQGLRDRRVRLSIGISREFFDLQDKLGFETASKTIEWLLGKSKKDIQELKNKSPSSSSSINEGEEGGVPKKVKMSQKDDSAREYRAKKREKARERTREKSCIVPRKCASDDHHYHHNQESNPNSGLTQLGPHYIHNNITTNNNLTSFLRVEEAIVSQTKMMTMMMRSPPGELKRV